MADKEQEDEEEGGGEEATSDAGRREEGKAEEAREVSRGEVDVDVDGGGGGGGADEEEKMDLLWENFNEELQQALHQRVGSCRRADARAAAGAAGMELSPESSDAESESAAALRGHFGCAPMMLRPSSRAGGYRRTTSWVLLMKIFRRLFVIEKTIASASGRHGRARR
ncbi:hypothetical protein E2562_023175 [Oryza meyeriana var. granulata]|uniref:Uncharacterized protein n=1 Tax=Oryza meyeriana var. granulata TaxID=110450 RepID=A0A6G1BZH7_9ORYZ|nr:hypothetical protein E2562_023175 [Oryza meyeriana var. granulata]